jgi:hypothetical protein
VIYDAAITILGTTTSGENKQAKASTSFLKKRSKKLLFPSHCQRSDTPATMRML